MYNFLIHNINNKIARSLPYKGKVIDLGCGSAPYKKEILNKATEYIGVDWTHSLHNQRNVDILADLNQRLPFNNNYADTVVSFQVMEHLQEPDFFLSECYRILKPGGRFFLTVPFMWYIHEAPNDYFRYTRHGLEYLLKKNNFNEILITENTGFWQMWVLKFNYHTAQFTWGALKFLWIPLWWLGQVISPILDQYNKSSGETASYTVSAKKQ